MGQRQSSQADGQPTSLPHERLQPAGTEQVYRYPACRYLTVVRMVFSGAAIFTSMALAFSDLLSPEFLMGVYMLVVAVPLALLEFSVVIDFFCKCEGGGCCVVWSWLRWFSGWKRGLLYLAFIVGMLALRQNVIVIVTAIIIFVLAVLYFAEPWQYRQERLYRINGDNHPDNIQNAAVP